MAMLTTTRNALKYLGDDASTDTWLLYRNGYADAFQVIDAALAKANFLAATDPTTNDDEGDGYASGSLWFNLTGGKIFICEDASTSAAVWRQVWPAIVADMDLSLYLLADGSQALESALILTQIATPDAPAAGLAKLYAKLDNQIYHRPTGGAETLLCDAANISDILDELGTAERGDVLYRGASAWAFLPHGTAGQVLTSGGHGADPAWSDAAAASTNGWIAAGETWTYASAVTFTITGDKSAKYFPGMRLKLTQTTPKYFIIVAVGVSTDTTITVYGGSDYNLAEAAITSPYYSTAKTPAGFPADPAKWTIETTSTSEDSQASPTASTIYNLGSRSIALPIGKWLVSFSVLAKGTGSTINIDIRAGLSTANNSFSSARFVRVAYTYVPSAGNVSLQMVDELISCAAATTYYLNGMTPTSSVTAISWLGSTQTTVIKAVCAYL